MKLLSEISDTISSTQIKQDSIGIPLKFSKLVLCFNYKRIIEDQTEYLVWCKKEIGPFDIGRNVL